MGATLRVESGAGTRRTRKCCARNALPSPSERSRFGKRAKASVGAAPRWVSAVKSIRRFSVESRARFPYAEPVAQPPRRILVVDDDVVILRLVRESLTALAGCEVDT